eukprot:m.122844 g.122844  ORF g.122844 m.122844 type:complete len:417 (-) comp14434_c2_seq1:58-1308(-)
MSEEPATKKLKVDNVCDLVALDPGEHVSESKNKKDVKVEEKKSDSTTVDVSLGNDEEEDIQDDTLFCYPELSTLFPSTIAGFATLYDNKPKSYSANSPFLVFCIKTHDKIKHDNPDLSFSEILNSVASMWLDLSPQQREKYEKIASKKYTSKSNTEISDTKGSLYLRKAELNRRAADMSASSWRGYWADAEITALVRTLQTHGKDMEAIGRALKGHKSISQAKHWMNNNKSKYSLNQYIEIFQRKSENVGDAGGQQEAGNNERVCNICSEPKNILLCKTCESAFCQECLGSTDILWAAYQRLRDWHCKDCKTCDVCQLNTQKDKLLFCQRCPTVVHMHCVVPPLKAIQSPWMCDSCKEYEEFENASNLRKAEQKRIVPARGKPEIDNDKMDVDKDGRMQITGFYFNEEKQKYLRIP